MVLAVVQGHSSDQSTYDAKVVGFDQDKDVAVLCVYVPEEKLRPIPVGISADLIVGQKVYANGNPGEIASLALERLLGEWLQALLYYLLRLQFGLHGGVAAVNHKNISLMHPLKGSRSSSGPA